jgi:hypothetical protein
VKGGADPSEDMGGNRAGTARGLGSSAIGPQDGGVEDGRRADTVDGAAGAPASAVSPPAPAPPVIAAAAPLMTSPARTRRTTLPAATRPTAAGLRDSHRRRGVSLPAPGATRSVLEVSDRTSQRPAPHLGDAQAPPHTALAGGSGGAAVGVSPPPPAAVYGLLAAAIAAAALFFSALASTPAGQRPVLFVSLLERPG